MNVFHTMEFLLKYSEAIREKVKSGEVEIQGAAAWLHLSFMASEVYHLETGKVDFLGLSPRQAELLSSKVGLPPSMSKTSAVPQSGVHGVRTGADAIVPGLEALKMLKEGGSAGMEVFNPHLMAFGSMDSSLDSQATSVSRWARPRTRSLAHQCGKHW